MSAPSRGAGWPFRLALAFSLGATLLGAGVPTRESWQADVRVQSFDVTGGARAKQIVARIVVVSDNDDDARAARAELLLPVGVGVLRLAAGCTASPSAVTGLTGRVSCDLGDLPVRGMREITIVTTRAAVPGPRDRFAVFVMSDTPDPEPSNNYMERVVP